MSVWSGLENGIPTADMSPEELAPTSQQQLQWPKWGQYYETGGKAGEPPDIAEAAQLLKDCDGLERGAARARQREAIWHRMLEIHAEQVFTIGMVSGVPQPVVVRNQRCGTCRRRASTTGIRARCFGIYRPDTFWLRRRPAQRPPGRSDDAAAPRSAGRRGPTTISACRRARGAGSRARAARPSRMLNYTIHRILIMIPTLLVISVVMFVIIQLPPGDYLSNYIAGAAESRAKCRRREARFPAPAVRPRQALAGAVRRLARRVARREGLLRAAAGRLGLLVRVQPAGQRGGRRPAVAVVHRLNFATILFTWVVAFPIGVYSATHQYSWGDHGLTLLGYRRPGHAELPARPGADVLRQRASSARRSAA